MDDRTQAIKDYCEAYGLAYKDHAALAQELGGEEEWEGIACAGVLPDGMGTAVIVARDSGLIEAVEEWAGSSGSLEDRWTQVTLARVKSATGLAPDWPIHAGDE